MLTQTGAFRLHLITAVLAPLFLMLTANEGEGAGLPLLTEEQLQKVAAINHGGIRFSTTLAEFLAAHPDAKPTSPIAGVANGVAAYELNDDKAADRVIFAFLGQELIDIGYVFEAERVARNGDGFTLLDQAIARFGRPTSVGDACAHWDFPTIDRTVRSKATPGEWWLRICRRSSWEHLPAATSVEPTTLVQAITVKRRSSIPEEVMAGIRNKARLEHAGEPSDQAFFVEKQLAAYREVEQFAPDGIPPAILAHLKRQYAREHRYDFDTQLFQLK